MVTMDICGMLVVVLWSVIAINTALGYQKVHVGVYYETLCPDSSAFVTRQLTPTLKALGDYMDVEFIPYGKAKRDILGQLHCQHGRDECEGNILQSCALDLMEQGSREQIQFVHCVMEKRRPLENIPQCSEAAGISWPVVKQCAQSDQGTELQIIAEKKTQAISQQLDFVPTIVFNHKFNQQDQNNAQYDLLKIVCRHLSSPRPTPCPY